MRLLYPRNRTSVSTSRVSAKCQKETPPSGQGIGVTYWVVQRGTGRRSRESKGSRDALSGHAIYQRFALSSRKGFAMADSESSFVTSIEGLASLYAPPAERVVKATLDHVNSVGRAFINASPFLVMATGNQNGFDCSPKGDQPGFVQVSEDGRTLLIPDRRGNNKIDGLKNLTENSQVGLIFFVPGANETYRVNGRARISTDAEFKRQFTVNGKEPTTVIVVAV